MSIARFAEELLAGGVELLQYRDKKSSASLVLRNARELKRLADSVGRKIRLIMNDRADLCIAAGFDGVHLGQDDLSSEGARMMCKPPMLVGISTHNPQQVREADKSPVDYIAIGPVFATASKANPDPVVGLKGVRAARELTNKPLVAIGGITLENCRSVIEAGADSVAVITALLHDPRKSVEDFRRILG